MALNPQYEDIGKTFVTTYYGMFDDPNQRNSLVNLFNVSRNSSCISIAFSHLHRYFVRQQHLLLF